MTTPPATTPAILKPQLPDRYQPFPTLVLCSNVLVNVAIPMQVNGYPAFLVGRGPRPLVWLAAPVSMGDQERTFIVRESVSHNPAVAVVTVPEDPQTEVVVGGVRALVVRGAGDTAEIDQIDLRPVGLDVWGDKAALHIGGATLRNNTIVGAAIAFAIGG